ncbi:MAG: MFS transporter [Deltaproteobacteria bacterium]|nr:MFS transporter [Deltaproteobacteria bacterium]
MVKDDETTKSVTKFAGIEVPPELTKSNFFFLFFNTFLIGLLMAVFGILQPAFLKDVIKINQDFAGSINGLLMNLNELATFALVAMVGVLSDRVGRKILAILGFVVLAISFYLLGQANGIASFLQIPAGLSSQICAFLSFVPSRSAEFTQYAPGLLTTYVIRLFLGVGLILCYPQFITMVADYTYEKDRGKGMAMNGVMMGISSIIIFALFVPIMAKTGVLFLIYIIIAVALGGALSTGVFLKERLPETKQEKVGLMKIIPVVRKSIALKASYWCCMITRADIIVLATFVITWGVKYGKELGLSTGEATFKASMPMMVMGFATLVAFPILGIMLDKKGRVPVIILALINGGIAMFLLAVSPNPFSPLVYIAMIFAAVGMAGSIAGANTLASDASPKGMVGSILGGLNTMQPIGVLFFVGLGGYLFDRFSPGWAFALKGIASLILCMWIFMIKDRINTDLQQKI